jgi:hypothetical protein
VNENEVTNNRKNKAFMIISFNVMKSGLQGMEYGMRNR